MAKSEAFARIKRDVLAMTAAVPAGRVSTYHAMGEHIDVMPRHVAYLLATLKGGDRETIPWHRVVAKEGMISTSNKAKAVEQAERLMAEGVLFHDPRTIANFEQAFVAPEDLDCDVPRQTRPN